MGVDGRLLIGDAIWINTYYLPDNILDYLSRLTDKYPSLFEYNYMDGVVRNHDILIWAEEPTYLFPVETIDRRPLIINSEEQLKLMIPTAKGINLDDRKIWDASYGDFTIRLNDYYDQEDVIRNKALTYIANKQYEISEEASADYIRQNYGSTTLISGGSSSTTVNLHPDEVNTLSDILSDKHHTLVGRYMLYIAN